MLTPLSPLAIRVGGWRLWGPCPPGGTQGPRVHRNWPPPEPVQEEGEGLPMQEAQQEWSFSEEHMGAQGGNRTCSRSPSLRLSWGPHQPDSRAQACSHTYSFTHLFTRLTLCAWCWGYDGAQEGPPKAHSPGWGGEDGKTDGHCSDGEAEARGGESNLLSSPDKSARGPVEGGQRAPD